MTPESLSTLLLPKQPWCVRTALSASDLTDRMWSFQRAHPDTVVRFLRGDKMQSVQGLYDEFAAALQFPYYFGNNAGAFDECLADLSWLPGKTYVLAIFNSDLLLATEPNQLPLFIAAFERISSEWSVPIARGETWDRPAVPFHLIFQYGPERMRRLPSKIAAMPNLTK